MHCFKINLHIVYLLAICFSLLCTACTNQKYAYQTGTESLDISSYSVAENTCIASEKNASANAGNTLGQEVRKTEKPEIQKPLARAAAKTRKFINKEIKENGTFAFAAPAQLLHKATQRWKPKKEGVKIGWKDVVFMVVLLALLLLLGGILHNVGGLSFEITMLIAILAGFLVICIYIWYLFNY